MCQCEDCSCCDSYWTFEKLVISTQDYYYKASNSSRQVAAIFQWLTPLWQRATRRPLCRNSCNTMGARRWGGLHNDHPKSPFAMEQRETSNGGTERGDISRAVVCTNIHIRPSSKTGGRVREIGGLQFPMDNGTLITPWRRASCQVARRAINGWRGIKKRSNSLTMRYRVVYSKFILGILAEIKYKKFYKFCIAATCYIRRVIYVKEIIFI